MFCLDRKAIAIYFLIFAQSVHSQIKVQSFDSRDGLCQSHVFSICEDKYGYLWFGTFDGASRWDGLSFTNMHTRDGLCDNGVNKILRGRDEALYFGTFNGISRYSEESFQTIPLDTALVEKRITALYQDTDSTLYIAVMDGGIFVIKQNVRHRLTAADGLPSNNVQDIFRTGKGILYFCTDDGVCSYDGEFRSLADLEGKYVTCMCEGQDGCLYFGTFREGVYILKDDRWSSLNTNTGLPDNRISKISERIDGVIFIASFGGGVAILRDGAVETLTKENGLASNSVFDIYAGRDGSMYFGTVGGISVYKKSQIEVYNENTGLSRNYVIAVRQIFDGALLVGTQGGGVCVYKDGQWSTLTTKDGLAHDIVNGIYEHENVAYLCTYRGINTYKNGRIGSFSPGRLPGTVWNMCWDDSGQLYLGLSNGAVIYDGKELIRVPDIEVSVNAVLPMDDGLVYYATDEGVRVYRDNQRIKFSCPPKLDSLEVYNIHRSVNGALYFGTSGGLFIHSDGQWDILDAVSGLVHDKITGICEDKQGRIYLTTLRGINILEPQGDIRVLRNSDGLASEENSPDACFCDSNGFLWFGTMKGLTRYNPALDNADPEPPHIHISRMMVFDRDIPFRNTTEPLSFKYNDNYIKFDYQGIYLPAPYKVRYQVRLVGLDKEWIDTDQAFMQYASLNDGEYRFQVKAQNEWGVWSAPVEIPFSIRPPLWERWWFIFAIVVLIFGMTTHLISIRVKALLAVERLRTKIAADLHDNIGSGLTEISILSEVSSRQIDQKDVSGAKNNLRKISDAARSLVDSMSDIVWLVNPKKDSLYDLMVHLKDSYNDLFTSKGIKFEIDNFSVLQHVHLPMEYRQNLYLLFKEALNNTIKHSRCSEILFGAYLKNKILEMVLYDDGRGFQSGKDYPGHGLHNMRQRCKSIGGKLYVDSSPDSGTKITFKGRIP